MNSVFIENEKGELNILSNDQMQKLKFEILIPKSMNIANHKYLSDLKSNGKLKYFGAKVELETRNFSMFARIDEEGTIILADVPTILSTLYESIQSRRGIQSLQVNKEEWLILEKQELERFSAKCDKFCQKIEADYSSTKERMSIVWRWDPEE